MQQTSKHIRKHLKHLASHQDHLLEFIRTADGYEYHQMGSLNPEQRITSNTLLQQLHAQQKHHEHLTKHPHGSVVRRLPGEDALVYSTWIFKKQIGTAEVFLGLALEHHYPSPQHPDMVEGFVLKWWTVDHSTKGHHIIPERDFPRINDNGALKKAIRSRIDSSLLKEFSHLNKLL